MATAKKESKTKVIKKTQPKKNLGHKSDKVVKKEVKSDKKLVNKTVKKENTAVKKTIASKKVNAAKTLNSNLEVSVFDINGKNTGKMILPDDFFGAKVNKKLIAQAIRVHLVNTRLGNATTKTRGEVAGSTRKIYRQKGTGRARHGGIRAPIFVKGGIAHGPKLKDYHLSFPKKMVKKALISALSAKAEDKNIFVVSGVENLSGKTKQMADMFKKIGLLDKKNNLLFVMPSDNQKIFRAARNIQGVNISTVKRINAYEIIKHKSLVLMKESISTFVK